MAKGRLTPSGIRATGVMQAFNAIIGGLMAVSPQLHQCVAWAPV
jgi:hypothetical protein